MLLARLQGHAQRALSVRVDAHADDAAGELAYELVLAREERRVRSPVAEGHAEALRAADGDVRSELPRGHEDRQGQEVARHRDHRPGGVRALDEPAPVVDAAVGRRILHDGAEHLGAREVERQGVADDHLDVVRGGARSNHLDRLRVATVRHEERAPVVRSSERLHQVHRLGRGRRLVEERRVGDLERREVAHHRLEVEQGFETALRHLGLVRRVLRVPARVLDHVALDDRRRDAVGVPHPEKASPRLVSRGDRLRQIEQVVLAFGRGQSQRATQADRARDGLVDQLVERAGAHDAEHLGDLGLVGPDVPACEAIGVLQRTRIERGSRSGCGHRLRNKVV